MAERALFIQGIQAMMNSCEPRNFEFRGKKGPFLFLHTKRGHVPFLSPGNFWILWCFVLPGFICLFFLDLLENLPSLQGLHLPLSDLASSPGVDVMEIFNSRPSAVGKCSEKGLRAFNRLPARATLLLSLREPMLNEVASTNSSEITLSVFHIFLELKA